MYYRTYNDLTVRVIYLDKVQPHGKKLKLSLSKPVGGFKDTTDELITVNGGHTELQGTEKPETNHNNQALKPTKKIVSKQILSVSSLETRLRWGVMVIHCSSVCE